MRCGWPSTPLAFKSSTGLGGLGVCAAHNIWDAIDGYCYLVDTVSLNFKWTSILPLLMGMTAAFLFQSLFMGLSYGLLHMHPRLPPWHCRGLSWLTGGVRLVAIVVLRNTFFLL